VVAFRLLCAAIITSLILLPAHTGAAAHATSAWFKLQVQILASFDPDIEALGLRFAGVGAPSQNDERININTATAEELERLPGIGPTLASRIIEHRRKHGRFKHPQDIIIVRGMSASYIA
jgi:competence ComEA-like helix-hairpin-helix protein